MVPRQCTKACAPWPHHTSLCMEALQGSQLARRALVAVVSRLEGASLWNVDVCGLGVTQDGELGSQLGQVKGGHLQSSACLISHIQALGKPVGVHHMKCQGLLIESLDHMHPLSLEARTASEQCAEPHTQHTTASMCSGRYDRF